MADQAFTSKENGALFIQPNGPNTRPIYLSCHDVDDITDTAGSINPLYCIDESGNYKIVGTTQDPPDIITFSLGTYTGKRKEALSGLACPVPVYLVLRDCGKASVFDNFVRVAILDVVSVTSRTLAGWVKREEDTPAMTTFEVSAAPPIIDGVRLQAYTQGVTAALGIGSVLTFCNEATCAGNCGAGSDVCIEGFAVFSPVPLASATIAITSDGATWATTATPFAADEDIQAATCFTMDSSTTRGIVARSTTDAANPAEIAYTDNEWTSETLVNVGSTNGQFITSMYAIGKRSIWVGCDDGYVYFSEDGGVTWIVLLNGTVVANPIVDLYFRDEYVGVGITDSDEILVTADGGKSWAVSATGSGSGLNTIAYNGLFWWIGTNAGELFYSIDGDSWTERVAWSGQGTGTITDVAFNNKFIGFMTHNDATVDGHILMTVDGGYNWSQLDVPNNNGFANLYVCGNDLAYAIGQDTSDEGMVVKIYTA